MGVTGGVSFNTASKKFGLAGKEMITFSKEQMEELENFLMVQARETKDLIIESMRKTPKATWSYKRGNRSHHPSLPFNPPAIDGGALWTHIDFNPISKGPDFGVELGTDLKYGKWLEEGTTRMEERPWLVPGIKKKEPDIIKGIERIVGVNLDNIFKVIRKG